jgi:peptidyl-prolyl cis-trans isomerase A (cyclophilin A)
MRRLMLTTTCGLFALSLMAVVPILGAIPQTKDDKKNDKEKKLSPGTYARFDTTEGKFAIRLFDQDAPKTVENFVGLAEGTKEWTDPKTRQKVKKPFYDGLSFHRVIDGFMIQGGCPLGNGTGGPGYDFADEFNPKLRHSKEGILSMANSGPNTNGSQFFITLGPTTHLNDRHSVFGEVAEGMDVVRKIGKVKTANDRPVKPVVIQSVKIERVKG